MFTKKVTDSDDFIAMGASAQALYLHLNQGADDEGFTNQVQMAMFKAHASIDDLKVLLAKRFIIQFESGVIVIKHWRMHNTLRKDRFTPTNFQEELKQLGIKSNGSYTLDMAQAERLPIGCQAVAVDKSSINLEKEREEKVNLGYIESSTTATTDEENKLQVWEGSLGKGVVRLTEKQVGALLDELGLSGFDYYVEKLADFILEKGAKVTNHYSTILKWAREDATV